MTKEKLSLLLTLYGPMFSLMGNDWPCFAFILSLWGIAFLILHCLNSSKKKIVLGIKDQIHWDPLRVKWVLLDLAITCWAAGVQLALISLFSLSKIGNASQCQAAHFISSDFELKE